MTGTMVPFSLGFNLVWKVLPGAQLAPVDALSC